MKKAGGYQETELGSRQRLVEDDQTIRFKFWLLYAIVFSDDFFCNNIFFKEICLRGKNSSMIDYICNLDLEIS